MVEIIKTVKNLRGSVSDEAYIQMIELLVDFQDACYTSKCHFQFAISHALFAANLSKIIKEDKINA